MAEPQKTTSTPTLPTSPTTSKKLRIFSIDRVKMKCFLTGKLCSPVLLCEYTEDGQKPRKGYVDPEYALESDLLNDADKKKVSQLVSANKRNFQTMSTSEHQVYITQGTAENESVTELSRWEASDAYRFPELSNERARNWMTSVGKGAVSGISGPIKDYIANYGNSREVLRILREISYAYKFNDAVRMYISGRLRPWSAEEKLKAQSIANSYIWLKDLNCGDLLKEILNNSKVNLNLELTEAKDQIVRFLSSVIGQLK